MTSFAGAYVTSERATCGRELAGYVTNLEELSLLAGLGADAAAADVVFALLRREGADALRRVRGAFAVALWDETARRGVLATDQLGAGGLFYRAAGRRLVFASEIHLLLDLLGETPSPEEDALIRWLAYDAAATGQTLYAGIRRLGPGELIELGPDSYRARTYWKPRYTAPARGTVEEHVGALVEAATAAVERRLATRQATGVLLSGGLDSSSIVAFASRRPGRRLHGFSAVFPDHPEMDESNLIDEVADAFDLPRTQLEVRGGSMVAAGLAYVGAWRLPSLSPNLMFQEPLARAATERGVGVLLDGEGGDELFDGSPYVFADLVMRGRLLAAVRLAERLPTARAHARAKVLKWLLREWALKGAMPHAAHSLLRRMRPAHYGASWLHDGATKSHGRSADPWQWKTFDGPRWWSNLAYEFTAGRVQLGGHDFLRHKSALAGVAGRHPYLEDVDLVVEMLAIPSEASYDDTFDRPLLRRAVDGLVPDSVRLRPAKSYFDALFEGALTSTDRPALLSLLSDGAHVGRYVRLDLLRSWILGASMRPANWRWVVWRSAMAECWLRTLEDASFPQSAAAEWRPAPPQLELRRSAKAGLAV